MASGWLGAADADDSRLKVDVLARSHVVCRVVAPDGRCAIVKQAGEQASESGRTLQRELYVYRLAGWMPALAAVLPKPLLIDERRQLLVLESLAKGQEWPSPKDMMSIKSPGIAARLGELMAKWHRATIDVRLWPSIADGVLHLPGAVDEAIGNRSASARRFMRALGTDERLARALREALSTYRHQCLIHGDIRCDNWILDRSENPPSLKVLDWEMSGSGDPAWDVASVFSEAVVEAIREGADFRYDASGWPKVIESALTDFLRAYVAADGLLDPRRDEEWNRIILFAAARLLHIASEWAEYAPNVDEGFVDPLVEQARLLLGQRPEAAAILSRWTLP